MRRARATMPRVAALAGLAALVATSAFGSTAVADPQPVYPSAGQVAAAQAQVADASSQVAALDAQLAASRARVEAAQVAAADAAEAYNGAQLAAQASAIASAAARARATAARTVADDATLTLSRYAAEVYQLGGGLQQMELFLGAGGPQAVLDRVAGLDAVGSERARLMREADAANNLANVLSVQAQEAQARASADADAARVAYDAARASLDAASAQAATAAAEQATLVTALAALRKTSVDLERRRQAGLAERDRLAAEESRRKVEEAKRKAEALASAAKPRPRGSSPKPATPGQPTQTRPPAPRGGVAAVIAFARAQLGEPYLWGGSGPNAWDCSGLTQGAWRQAGVRLSHYTGAQWAETARVPISSLRPGDLVFFGSSAATIHHVGLYLGGGTMIHAPHTGDVVKISSIYYSSGLLSYGGRP